MKFLKYIFSSLLLFFVFSNTAFCQSDATIHGKIVDKDGFPIELVNISIKGLSGGTTSNTKGYYEMKVPANKNIIVVYSFVGYKTKYIKFNLAPGERRIANEVLADTLTMLNDFTVRDNRIEKSDLVKINPKEARFITSPSGGVEALVKTQMGVTSNNELSSQYNVRGGNYDENLIYVNDIEIYRPFLIRSGQQEGLSFLNSDLVELIQFSAGGFDAKYGDKMSSVLDITYKKPKRIGGSFSASLLGGSVSVEGLNNNKKLTYLLGVRYKSNAYLLKTLETKGDYKPSFFDIQSLVNYEFSDKFELSFLGNFSKNKYQLAPSDRETSFGTVQQVLRLKIYFDGQEIDKYQTMMGSLSANWKPNKKTKLKFITSIFNSSESETYDVQGQYWLDDIETDLGSNSFGDTKFNRGIGTFLEHARNYLYATVFNFEHRGVYDNNNHKIQWGAKFQFEAIDDKLDEWRMNDSAGYIIPNIHETPGDSTSFNDPSRMLTMSSFYNSKNYLESGRFSGFIQDYWAIGGDSSQFVLNAGLRYSYWTVNKQFLLSPRVSLFFTPKRFKKITFRFSSGIYNQPPFYREIRDEQGNVNTNVKAQSSVHFVLGSDLKFKIWDRPFKFSTELYYKYLDNLIPYVVDNVRIRYYAKNNAIGYATGLDLKLIGEFVPGTDSWITVSIMQTKEDIANDYYIDSKTNKVVFPDYIPRPTDQILNVNLFFQDYIPKFPTYKMHLNLVFGTGLPFGAPGTPKYLHDYRSNPYKRVDIGFSKQLFTESGLADRKGFWKNIRSGWLSLEVFNLLQISNTISYIWVSDIFNNRYAVPNYLTPRQVNLKFMIDF